MTAATSKPSAERTTARALYVLRVHLARQDAAQSRVLEGWAADLEAAQKAGDWNAVALARSGIAATAVVLRGFTVAILEEFAASDDPELADLARQLLAEDGKAR